MTNPYPKTIIDESSGIEVSNPLHIAWNEGANLVTVEHCRDCIEDDNIFCPRNPDAECLECGARLCGGHIGAHLLNVHCISLDNDYCTRETPEGG